MSADQSGGEVWVTLGCPVSLWSGCLKGYWGRVPCFLLFIWNYKGDVPLGLVSLTEWREFIGVSPVVEAGGERGARRVSHRKSAN